MFDIQEGIKSHRLTKHTNGLISIKNKPDIDEDGTNNFRTHSYKQRSIQNGVNVFNWKRLIKGNAQAQAKTEVSQHQSK